ncbi:MAG: sulfatase-like hydrolase/transferase [Nitrospiraceae bacterium]|nr:sulfatase-like hydrolase/transferase [Nitrospiraceae bacterium]
MPSRRPNILILFPDQMRFDAMGCAGNDVIQTPNLDRMALEGVHFRQAVTPAPLCVPARHCLLTGQHCAAHGRWGNIHPEPEPFNHYLPELLANAGYLTESIGKMHFMPPRRHFGFERMQLMEEIPEFREDDEYLCYLKQHGYGHIREVHGVRNLLYHIPQVSVIPEEHHGSTWVADRTVEFLRRHMGEDRPFFLMAGWIAPHPPWNAPEPFASMYRNEDMPLPVNYDRDRGALPNQLRWRKYQECMGNAAPERLQRIKALYYGNVSLIDKGVGRILDTLDMLGMSDDTLVIFASDHGEMLGDQGCWQKHSPYEASVRVPFLMRMPGTVEQGRASDELITLHDIMPTALELAGVEYPGTRPMRGASLLGKPGGGLSQRREETVIELFNTEMGSSRRFLSLRRPNVKYNYFLRDGWEELYDLERDPEERNNLLLGSPSEHDRRTADEMKAVLTEWEKQHGFASSLDEKGELKNQGMEIAFHAKVNPQFPLWVENVPVEEKALMETPGESVVNAIQHEDTFRLEDLELKRWHDIGGSLEGTPFQHLLEEASEESEPVS